ncbi:MAG: preprotein translocase subunit SecE [candidate division WOR-3 bacterium]|nr:MAG: preprotein translocase subunit SecE [candidate division WOR-3 bacterium]
MKKIIEYLKRVYTELRKVTWPTRNELVNSTIVVIIISAIVALIIFILDTIFSSLLRLIL